MVKCANCKKELKWYQIVHPFGSKEAFCGWGCWKEYKKKMEEIDNNTEEEIEHNGRRYKLIK